MFQRFQDRKFTQINKKIRFRYSQILCSITPPKKQTNST